MISVPSRGAIKINNLEEHNCRFDRLTWTAGAVPFVVSVTLRQLPNPHRLVGLRNRSLVGPTHTLRPITHYTDKSPSMDGIYVNNYCL